MSFLDFYLSSNWERERVVNEIWVLKKMAPKLLILFFFDGVPLENLFFFHGQIDFVLFFLHWHEEPGVLRVSVILLSSTRSKMAMVRPPATNPAQKLIFLSFTSAKGKGVPLPFWGPSQSFGFSLLPLGVRRPGWGHQVPTSVYPLCDPHSLLTVTFLTARYC